MKAFNYLQLITYDGQVLKKDWTAKQVKGAINPGDIYKQESGEGEIQFIRLAKTDPKVKTVSETKEEKKEPSKADAELIAKMEKMAQGSDPGKAYAAELFLKALKKKK